MIERSIEFIMGVFLAGLGFSRDSISLKVFFFFMAAMFLLAIFRPAKLT